MKKWMQQYGVITYILLLSVHLYTQLLHIQQLQITQKSDTLKKLVKLVASFFIKDIDINIFISIRDNMKKNEEVVERRRNIKVVHEAWDKVKD
mgnify:CR=1 FL=1